jgi:hypothetical protein
VIESASEAEKGFLVAVNSFISSLRGPLAESRFADQVHHLKALKKPWRFGIELHDTVYGLAEALLNIWRRQRREEALIFSSDKVSHSALLCYHPTVFDDYVLKDRFNDEPCMNDLIFEFRGEEDIPCSLRGIFLHAEDYTAALIACPQHLRQPATSQMSSSDSETDEELQVSRSPARQKPAASSTQTVSTVTRSTSASLWCSTPVSPVPSPQPFEFTEQDEQRPRMAKRRRNK